MKTIPAHLLATFLLCLPPLSAQATKVIPASATNQDANSASAYPFTSRSSSFRFAQLIEGSAICDQLAVLTALAYRRDAQTQTPYRAHHIPYIYLRLTHSRRIPMTMSQRFTENWGGQVTQPFAGALSLPAQPPVTSGTAPFNVVIPFNQQVLYTRATGDLLTELATSNYGSGPGLYDLDGHAIAHGATTRHFGTRGQTSRGDRYALDLIEARELRPGGTLDLRFTNFMRPYLGAIGLGVSNRNLSGLILPFDLTIVGAPGNFVYHSWDVPFATQIRDIGTHGVHQGAVRVTMPSHPGLLGSVLYAQGFVLDGDANALGMVFSDRLDLQFATHTGPFQSIAAFGTITGRYLVGRDVLAGPVVQFRGTFN